MRGGLPEQWRVSRSEVRTVDFNAFANAQNLNAALATVGVAVASLSPSGAKHPVMLFNSSAPTGGAFALGSPNENCAPIGVGEGAGNGGRSLRAGENCVPLQQCLILSEDCDLAKPTPPKGKACDGQYDVPYNGDNAKHIGNGGGSLAPAAATLYGVHEYPAPSNLCIYSI